MTKINLEMSIILLYYGNIDGTLPGTSPVDHSSGLRRNIA